MTEVTAISAQAAALLMRYFDLGGDTAEQFVAEWLVSYPAHWLRLALVEALYQGRYKAVSVEHILLMWQRRGQPLHHFNHEFERLVCSNFLQDVNAEPEIKLPQPDAVLPKLALTNSFISFDLAIEKAEDFNWQVEAEKVEVESLPVEESNLPQGREEERERTSEMSEGAIATPLEEASESSDEAEESSEETPIPTIKYTDFYSKLKAVAEAKKKEEERRKRRER